ncbi:hypothetical protein HNI00_20350 [Thermoleptolyngbya oregonensis NK1-22]|uniref:Uncharacterized protein n=1 Tax=Thermoleptolyngbya oregonensis NK1-22 TaxID=2547457 RepID=A0AA96Y6W5_9CYAN|nr:hypothetical protein [Thermoleptolyngbya oregonensis]WOB45225.1 hypothetical protein HNI00_20350 [Thermoleptolyngbya oregonensis NK1-22]
MIEKSSEWNQRAMLRRAARSPHAYTRSRVRVAAAVAPQPEVLTTKGLDFLSLAVCSCALTLLCHSATSPLHSASPSNTPPVRPSAMSRTATTPSFAPFTLVSPSPEVKEQDEDQDL